MIDGTFPQRPVLPCWQRRSLWSSGSALRDRFSSAWDMDEKNYMGATLAGLTSTGTRTAKRKKNELDAKNNVSYTNCESQRQFFSRPQLQATIFVGHVGGNEGLETLRTEVKQILTLVLFLLLSEAIF